MAGLKEPQQIDGWFCADGEIELSTGGRLVGCEVLRHAYVAGIGPARALPRPRRNRIGAMPTACSEPGRY